jgi:hypothetical protein
MDEVKTKGRITEEIKVGQPLSELKKESDSWPLKAGLTPVEAEPRQRMGQLSPLFQARPGYPNC